MKNSPQSSLTRSSLLSTVVVLVAVSAAASLTGCSGSEGGAEEEANAGALTNGAPSVDLAAVLKKAADSPAVMVFSGNAKRNLKKTDKDFELVMSAINVHQTPVSADEVPQSFAIASGPTGVQFLDASGTGQGGLQTMNAPTAKDRVVLAMGDDEIGVTVDGTALAKIAKAAPATK